jgi:hypothetical protein
MSHATKPSEGIDSMSFANAVAIAVEQIITAQGSPSSTQNDNIRFSISSALDQSDILNYLYGIGAKIFSKTTEPLKTIFSVKNPDIRILLRKLQVRSESFGWNPLFQINTSQETNNPSIQSLNQPTENAHFRTHKEKQRLISTQTPE